MRACLCLTIALAHMLNFEHAGIFGGVDLGYYYVDLRVGTPPTKQTVIVDTGSGLTAFPCAGCEHCGHHIDSYFDYRLSSTSRRIGCSENVPCNSCKSDHCQYYQGYAEGSSISGFLVEDYIQLGDDDTAERTKLVFGCHDEETNLFKTQLADGIMGLAFAKKDTKRMNTIVDILYQNHEISTDVFALCLGQTDGYMTVGGYNSSLHLGPLVYADLHDSVYYAVNFKGVRVAEHKVSLRPEQFGSMYGGAGSIVDSGTTFVYLREEVHDGVWTAFESHCGGKDNCRGERVSVPGESHFCYHNNNSNLTDFYASFPTIHLEIDNITLAWEPERYLFTWPDHPSDYCFGVYSNGNGGSVLGGLFMRGMDIVFDRVTDTIGFAKADCNATTLIGSNTTSTGYIPTPSPRSGTSTPMSLIWLVLIVGTLLALIAGLGVCVCWRRRYVPLLAEGEVKPGWATVQAKAVP